ncbi:molybdenum ABC transporter ATP-binding protein [Geovibrio thiophilus]|uniref:Molybdenum ABC transporter ATP-binding protein n=1 Tax=Geovibrio thiophilus TaxID=139438 RepID=A0A3R5X451_9BACT|nr:molybdenum ABC transporter ATP-binding protein [Geovibrio thiophilus]QAR33981.1 molybdenum ABC transporter ATP-binding protein [Geovibrio thiophilus]
MLEFSAIKRYPAFTLDVSFKMNEGMVTGLFGRSGSGKTSIINIAAGLINPDEGYVSLDGKVLYDSSNKINLPAPARSSGYIFQDGRLFPHMTVEANLRYGMKRSMRNGHKAGFDDVVELLGIGDLLKRRPHRLSGGEKQRVAIGRALLSSPDFLLMDEPLSALDSHRKEELIPFIGKMVQTFKLPVLYVTHSIDELFSLCDNVVLMKDGRCTDFGTVEEAVSRPANREILGLSGRVSVLRASAVSEKEPSIITFENGRLGIPTSKYATGTELRVAVHSDDVTLALNKPTGLSARNIMKGMITAVDSSDDGAVAVTVDVGVPVYATITRSAASELGIRTGTEVYIIMKTIALSRLSVPFIH